MGIDQYLAGGTLQNSLSMRNLSMGCGIGEENGMG